jgi:hypothetical protein
MLSAIVLTLWPDIVPPLWPDIVPSLWPAIVLPLCGRHCPTSVARHCPCQCYMFTNPEYLKYKTQMLEKNLLKTMFFGLVLQRPFLGLDCLIRIIMAKLRLSKREIRDVAARVRRYEHHLIRHKFRCCKMYRVGSMANTLVVAGKSDLDLTIICTS